MRTNKTKAKLKNGESVFGCFVRYPNATMVEVLGYFGWDFIVFDGEHGPIEPLDCEHMVRAAELRDVTPIIRVPVNSPPVILRFLDTGAQGLHVPMVQSKADAQAVVRAVKYQPIGVRGLAGVRAADYGQAISFAQYVAEANAETLVSIHIETKEAVENLPEILTVDEIDVIFVGPNDLSQSLGVPGDIQNPIVQSTIERVAEQVAASSRALGIMVGNVEAAQRWRQRGARYISIMSDNLLGPACRSYLAAVRK